MFLVDPAKDIEKLGDILDKGLDELNTTAEDGSVDEVLYFGILRPFLDSFFLWY